MARESPAARFLSVRLQNEMARPVSVQELQRGIFADWRLTIDGMVAGLPRFRWRN